MKFYLGTHETSWLAKLDVPLFISHRRLAKRCRLPRARCDWALDFGGFTELALHGAWRTSLSEYVEAVARYGEQIGRLEWAAPMDWMCEPFMLETTGLPVRAHQELTIANYLQLRGHGPFIPVLQGWTVADYERCAELYESAGVDLRSEPLVGIGSVCRRQRTAEIAQIMHTLHGAGIRTHGFGSRRRASPATGICWARPTRRRGVTPPATNGRSPAAHTATAPTVRASPCGGAMRSSRAPTG